MTGFGSNFPGLLGKDLQILKEAVPTISRVAVVATSDSGRRELDVAGSSMKLDMRWVTVDAPAEFESAFATMMREQADAVFVTGTALNYAHLRRIAGLAMTHRMPSFFEAREFAEFGGLLCYGWSAAEIARNDGRESTDTVEKLVLRSRRAASPEFDLIERPLLNATRFG